MARKLNIYSWFGYQIPMEDRFRLIKAAGFDGVMLWWGDEYAHIDGNKSLQPEMGRRFGLEIENMHTPFSECNSLWEDSTRGDDYERVLSQCIEDCRVFEIPTAVVHVTSGDYPPPFSNIGLDRICRLVEHAERKGINLALENLRRPEYLDFIYSGLKSERLGLCYDSGHENCYTKGTDILQKYGSKLMTTHLHDNDGTSDQHLIPGEGSIGWEAVLEKLRSAGFKGALSFEVTREFSKACEGLSPEIFLMRAFEEARRLGLKLDGIA